MLLFSTVLNIRDSVTPEDFLRLVLEWNETAKYRENVVPGIAWKGERSIRYGTEKLWLEFREHAEKNILAVRHEKVTDAGVVWDSDFIADFARRQIAVRLDRTYSEDALVIGAAFSTPHFITLLVEHGFLEDDRDIPVLNKPVLIHAGNLQLVSRAIEEPEAYELPIVIVTKAEDASDPVDVCLLASRLKGAAHVMTEESYGLCTELFDLPEGYEKNGAVRVYYPADSMRRKLYHYRSLTGNYEWRLEQVIRSVIQYTISQKTDVLMTWQGVTNDLLNHQLWNQIEKRKDAEKESQQARDEMEQVYEAFDEDLRTLQEKVAELTKANEALQAENQGLRAKYASSENVPLIYYGDEQDFFSDEIKEMVLDAVETALGKANRPGRRGDVLEDILENNPCEHTIEQKKKRIKELFKGYKSFSGAMRQELESLGFEITGEGKHCKISYRGDSRYLVVAAKTPSDTRSGDNLSSRINKTMYFLPLAYSFLPSAPQVSAVFGKVSAVFGKKSFATQQDSLESGPNSIDSIKS